LTADIRIHETGNAIQPPTIISTTIPANSKIKGSVGKYASPLSSELRSRGHITVSSTNTIGPASQEDCICPIIIPISNKTVVIEMYSAYSAAYSRSLFFVPRFISTTSFIAQIDQANINDIQEKGHQRCMPLKPMSMTAINIPANIGRPNIIPATVNA